MVKQKVKTSGHRPERNRDMSDTKKIIIADSSEEFRGMLAELVEEEADLSVAAQTDNGEELLDLIARHRPDVVIMDLMLAGMDGLEVLELSLIHI